MNRKYGLTTSLLAASSLMLIGLAGCDKPGSAESAGRKFDQSMDKMERKVDQVAESARTQAAQAGEAINDTAITAAVKASILAEPGLKVLQIDVDTKNGQVTLSGSVDTPASVQKAAQVASNVDGVKSVDNRLVASARG